MKVHIQAEPGEIAEKLDQIFERIAEAGGLTLEAAEQVLRKSGEGIRARSGNAEHKQADLEPYSPFHVMGEMLSQVADAVTRRQARIHERLAALLDGETA